MTDMELNFIKKKAERYAGLQGAKHPEIAHVARYNGYFQGFMDAINEDHEGEPSLSKPQKLQVEVIVATPNLADFL